MEKQRLGNSDLQIMTIGFGAWAIGGAGYEYAWGAQDDQASIEAVHCALDLGINWIDTAAAYGIGHSEEMVARALTDWSRTRPYIFTKCGLRWDQHGKIFKVLEPESIRREYCFQIRHPHCPRAAGCDKRCAHYPQVLQRPGKESQHPSCEPCLRYIDRQPWLRG